jgi:hypothetical protein
VTPRFPRRGVKRSTAKVKAARSPCGRSDAVVHPGKNVNVGPATTSFRWSMAKAGFGSLEVPAKVSIVPVVRAEEASAAGGRRHRGGARDLGKRPGADILARGSVAALSGSTLPEAFSQSGLFSSQSTSRRGWSRRSP